MRDMNVPELILAPATRGPTGVVTHLESPLEIGWWRGLTMGSRLRAADSLEVLPEDPAAAAEEIQRRREEIGFSYFVFGANAADALAPVVAKLAGH